MVDFSSKALVARINKEATSQLWHLRMGHPLDNALHNLNSEFSLDSSHCETCCYSKQQVFELVHFDVWDNAPVDSRDGFKYFVTFIDNKSRTTWLYLLTYKSEVLKVFQEFCSMVHTQYGCHIKILRTDNGIEYTNHPFESFLKSLGIIHQTSCVGTPQQNGVAEWNLLEVTRALLFHGNFPKTYWSYAVLSSYYLINRLPSKILRCKSPMEVLVGRPVDISHLRIFGSICFVHFSRGKLDPCARKCVFIGYFSVKKGYKCFDPSIKKVYISHDVVFDEDHMFFFIVMINFRGRIVVLTLTIMGSMLKLLPFRL